MFSGHLFCPACAFLAEADPLWVCDGLRTPTSCLTTRARVSPLTINTVVLRSSAPQKECTGGLLKGASAGLKAGGYLIIYGPFALNGLLVPDSNKGFDESLKARSGGSWGIRDVAWVASLADEQGLELKAMTLMPANNFFVVFTKVTTYLLASGGVPVVAYLLLGNSAVLGGSCKFSCSAGVIFPGEAKYQRRAMVLCREKVPRT